MRQAIPVAEDPEPGLKLNVGTTLISIALFAFLVSQFWGRAWTAQRIAGFAILIPALLLLVVARMQLGSAFSITAKASSTLVTTGLYSRIRNPIYVFGSLLLLGLCLWVSRPRFLLAFILLVPLQIFRSRREERVLTEKFGTAYLDYRRRTWF